MSESSGEAVLNGLAVEPAEFKPIPRGKPASNPMLAPLEQSWEEDRPLSVKVTAREAVVIERKLRKGAMKAGFGVAIQIQMMPSEEVCPLAKLKDLSPDQEVRVVFQARELSKAARHEDDDE